MRVFVLLSTALLTACAETMFYAPHQPYAPLLDHAGQVDVVARAGWQTPGDYSAAVMAAYAPIDHLEVAASVEYQGDIDEHEEVSHFGGGVAIGSFVRDDVFRLEGLVGVHAGHGQGISYYSGSGGASSPSDFYDWALSGTYVAPFAQVSIGFEIRFFEFAGGLRIHGAFADVSAEVQSGRAPSASDRGDPYARAMIDPYVVLRVPFDIVRLETLMGMNFALNPTETVLGQTSHDDAIGAYLLLGVGVQIDTM